MLRNESTYKLSLDKNTYRAIKMQTGTTINVQDFIQDCIYEYKNGESGNGLFNADKHSFWSESLLRRMQKYEEIKQKRSAAGKKAMQNRWGKQNDNKAIRELSKRKINGYSRNNKIITNVIKNNNNVITNAIKKYREVITKNNKSNKIKSNQIKLNKIKLKEMKSIFPSGYKANENKILDDMMDETEKMEYELLIHNCEMNIFTPELAIEISGILKEMYMNPDTREKVQEINSKKLCYALKNYAIANTRSQIKIPKAYFKKCVLSALEQTELSTQYDTDTIMTQLSEAEE